MPTTRVSKPFEAYAAAGQAARSSAVVATDFCACLMGSNVDSKRLSVRNCRVGITLYRSVGLVGFACRCAC